MLCSTNGHHYYSFFKQKREKNEHLSIYTFYTRIIYIFFCSFVSFHFIGSHMSVCCALLREMEKENDNISFVNKTQNHVFRWQSVILFILNRFCRLMNSGNLVDFFYLSALSIFFSSLVVGWLGFYAHVSPFLSFILIFFVSVCVSFAHFQYPVSQRDTKYFFDILRIWEKKSRE